MKKLNIGLDIDNVITDFNKGMMKEYLIEDKKKRNHGIINPKSAHLTKGMFDWSEEEVENFHIDNMERIAKDFSPRLNCKKYMDKLLVDGHKLFLITNRQYPHYKSAEKTTVDWLKKHNINYTKLILSKKPDKTEEYKENNIDIMIDDRPDQCKLMRAHGINVMLMFTKYNKVEKEDLNFATSWKNLYEEITKLCPKERRTHGNI